MISDVVPSRLASQCHVVLCSQQHRAEDLPDVTMSDGHVTVGQCIEGLPIGVFASWQNPRPLFSWSQLSLPVLPQLLRILQAGLGMLMHGKPRHLRGLPRCRAGMPSPAPFNNKNQLAHSGMRQGAGHRRRTAKAAATPLSAQEQDKALKRVPNDWLGMCWR